MQVLIADNLQTLPYRLPLSLAVLVMPCIIGSSCHLLMATGFDVTGKGASESFVSWSAETDVRPLA